MDDIAVPQHHRVGAHRARRHPALAVAVPVAVVAVVAGVFVWGLLAFVGGGGDDEPLDVATGSPQPTASAPATAGALPSPGSPLPTASAPLPSAEPSASVPVGPDAGVDRTTPVVVLNSTGTAGLAATGGEQLTGLGWQVSEVGNFGAGEISTTVFYNGPELAGTAQAVVADLGLGVAQESVEYDPGSVVVVLGSDYTPS